MNAIIGFAAGEIWKYLIEKKSATVIEIKSNLGVSNTIMHLALGWLMREDKIEIAEAGHTYKVLIKEQ